MPAGCPSDYDAEIVLKKSQEYLDSCIEFEIDKDNPYKRNVDLPSIAGLADYINVARSTIYDWAKAYKEFGYMVERVMTRQEKYLINNGTSGNYNSSVVKLLLHKHGHTDKTELSTDPEKPLVTKIERVIVDRPAN